MENETCGNDSKPVNFPVRAGEFRKILKPHRHIFANRVCLNHPERRQQCPLEQYSTDDSLKSSSTYNLEPSKKANELFRKSLDVPKLDLPADWKDGCTQTSKTILQLAQMQGDGLSPDSLMASPQKSVSPKKQNLSLEEVIEERPTVDNPANERRKFLTFNRKAAIKQFFEGCQSPNGYPSPTRVPDDAYPKKSLMETFLSKSKNRDGSQNSSERTYVIHGDIGSGSSSGCDENRSKFLQQTSPLRHLIKRDSNSLKSKSCVEPCHPNYIPDVSSEESTFPQESRFRVTQIRNRTIKDETKSLKYFTSLDLTRKEEVVESVAGSESESSRCTPRRPRFTQNRRSNSFMSPTIASERKSQMREIRHVTGLISPTRRGRSSSPKVTNLVEKLSSRRDALKIPYIDQSDLEVPVRDDENANELRYNSKEQKNKFKGKINSLTHKKSKEPGKLSPLINKPVFEEDLLRIDELSLDINTSEGNLTGSVRVCNTNSNSSLDDAVANAISKLRDQDWNTALKGLAEITELCRLLDSDLIFAHMTAVNQRLIELLRSPRSHVCRTACQAAGHLFESMKDTRRPEFDDIVNLLLFKTADANKFIRQDANLSLDCMVTHISTFHAIRTLCAKGPSHKNYLVRSATARLLVCAVVIAGADSILNPINNEHTRKRIMLHMAKFITDKNLETRKYGERLYKVLSKEANFDMYLRKYFDREEVAQLKKSLKLIDRKNKF